MWKFLAFGAGSSLFFFRCCSLSLSGLYLVYFNPPNWIRTRPDWRSQMKVVCVICTELLLINSHISVCSCGHVFHEECLFKWIRTGQLTCPQCRCKLKEKEIVKRLYLTEFDITSSQTSSDFRSIEVNQENYERLLNKVEELKQSMKEQTDALQAKSKLIEQVWPPFKSFFFK